MRRLIVNADDLGADEGRNAGIAEAVSVGSVTSVSILANGPALEDALARLRPFFGARVSAGVHLNVSEGRPLSRDLRLLAGSSGLFRGKGETHRLLEADDPAVAEEVLREFEAQVSALVAAGVPISHVDGHQHVHLFPGAARAAAAVARGRGIAWVRIPAEPPPERPVPEPLVSEAALFARRAAEARSGFAAAGLCSPDHFRGLWLRGRGLAEALEEMIARLPEGLTELMVHPGRVSEGCHGGPFSRFATADRERELAALLAPGFRAALIRGGVRLTPFPESLP